MTGPPTAADATSLLPLGLAALAVVLRWTLLAGEAALSAVGSDRADELREGGHRGRAVARLKADAELTTGGVRTALALTLVLLTAAVTVFALGPDLPEGRTDTSLRVGAGALVAWLITALTDPLPRSLAMRQPERWALRTSLVLLALRALLGPVARAVAALGDLLLRPFGARVRFSLPPPPLEEIERMLTQTRQAGAPEPALVRSLFDFAERTVKEIMVPRTAVQGLPYEAEPEEMVRLFLEEGHTRMPVYRGTLDTILGIVHVKDVLPFASNPRLIIIEDLLRPVPFVPWNRTAGQVMRELQTNSQHFAVVVDEYGGVAGIVTLEDIVEELVGDIRDEFDVEVPAVVPVAEGVSLVRGDMRLPEFRETFGVEIGEEGGYETLGGLLSSLAGDIPAEGDRFFVAGLELQVVRRDPRRVLEVRVTRMRPAESASAEHRV